MKNLLKEIVSNPNFANITINAFNLQLAKKGTKGASFISSLGRCFCETKSQRALPIEGRIKIGQADILDIYQHVVGFMNFKGELDFKFSNSGLSLYLNMNTALYNAITEALLKYGRKEKNSNFITF